MSREPGPVLDLSRLSRLPAELRFKVWEAACPTPSMHVFDLCLPSASPQAADGSDAVRRAFVAPDEDGGRYARFKDSVFLDTHRGVQQQPRSDPSMYRQRMALEAVCFAASLAVAVPSLPRRPGGWAASTSIGPSSAGVFTADVNTVYLPGPDRHVHYNNRTDVLHLCSDGRNLGSLLGAQWSDEAAETIRTASRIALDAVDAAAMMGMMEKLGFEDEIVFLACMVQQGLEVLYLVDYCVGRCQCCGRHQVGAGELSRGDRVLPLGRYGNSKAVAGDGEPQREPDVVWGVRRTYREVLDLERLGWTSDHLAYRFAQAIGSAIQEQQVSGTGTCQLQGVRVLVAEDQ